MKSSGIVRGNDLEGLLLTVSGFTLYLCVCVCVCVCMCMCVCVCVHRSH